MNLADLEQYWQRLPDWAPAALVAALVMVLLLLIGLAMWRSHKGAAKGGPQDGRRDAVVMDSTALQWLRDGWHALRYLSTRREWRYKVPWVVMLGERLSGKSRLLHSLTTGQRQQLLLRERNLAFKGSEWAFFDGGVVIDVEGRLSAAADDDGARTRWTAVLDKLNRLRPERPMDAVVLSVSASTLLSDDADRRRQAAETCYRQLWELQKAFEFSLPVYLVVTQCDAIEGYEAFWSRQSASRRRQIMGWSNPYGLAHEFEPGWADAAFDELRGALQGLLVQTAAGPEQLPDFDEFFLFPQHFQALRAPLRELLGYVFRAGAYHENFALRGLYFTGCLAAAAENKSLPGSCQVDFADGLFSDRIFAEPGLARPTNTGVLSRNRVIRRLQLGAGALLLGLFVALAATALRLDGQVDAAVAALNLLDNPEPSSDTGCVGAQVVYPLLEKIAHIDVDLVYPTIPASWFDNRISEGTAAFVSDAAFEDVFFPSLACQLLKRGQGLLQGPPPVPKNSMDPAQASAAQRAALMAYATDIAEFERNRARLKTISAPAARADARRLMGVFAELAGYAYQQPLPSGIRQAQGQHLSALAKVSYTVPAALSDDYGVRLSRRLEAAMKAARDVLEADLGAGITLIQGLDSSEGVPDGRQLSAWLRWVQSAWLTGAADPCAATVTELTPLTDGLVHDHGYPAGLSQTVVTVFGPATCQRPALERLSGLRAAPYGALFESDGTGYRMIPALVAELPSLAALAELPYMQLPVTEGFECRLALAGWRPETVAEAARMMRQYQAFSHAQPGAGDVSQGLPIYQQVARRKLQAVLDQLLTQSQRSQRLADSAQPLWLSPLSDAEELLAGRSLDFSRAVGNLMFVLGQYSELGFAASRAHIAACVQGFARGSLDRLNDLADASSLYLPTPNPSLPVEQGSQPYFDLGGAAQAKDYLKRQLDRSQVLVGYAAPFVQLLRNTAAVRAAQAPNNASAAFWTKTIGEINDYIQYKQPVGQVVNIEQFIEQVVALLAPTNCAVLLADYKSPAGGNDLFSQKRIALEKRANWYCHNHSQAVVWDQYDGFATRFNQQLAGRYPFGPIAAPDASLPAVASFLRDYQQQRQALADNLQALPEDQGLSIRQFVDRLDRLSDFFATTLAAESGAQQPVAIRVGFRYRPDQSSGDADLVRWRLRVGEQVANYPNGPDTLAWKPGDAVRLELDWANLAGVKPAPDKTQPDLQAQGLTANFVEQGPWALLQFIDRHRSTAAKLVDVSDPNKLVLGFRVPQQASDSSTAKPGFTQVYVTLSLTSLDAKTGKPVTLSYPQTRPLSAPTIWGGNSDE